MGGFTQTEAGWNRFAYDYHQSIILLTIAERLQLDKTWLDDGQLFASWCLPSRRLLHKTRCNLHRELHRSQYRSCIHLKGHGNDVALTTLGQIAIAGVS